MDALLSFNNVDYSYKDGSQQVSILREATYSFEKGKIYAIVGASGSGKTTSIILAAGLDEPKNGNILFNGKDIKQIGLTKYRRDAISMVFQSYNLIYYLNAYQNVINALNISKKHIKNKKEYANKILEELGLCKEECKRDIRKLSGGQQQRVAIARAIAKDVDLILCDEPTGNLDEENSKAIIDTLIDLAHNKNKCVIVVTHSKEFALQLDVQLKIMNGKLVEIKN